MLRFVLLLSLMLFPLVISKRKANKDSSASENDLGENLVSVLRTDANIDLPVDEEYEDIRAELLAYHTALSSISSSRRSMKTTECWKLGGICVDHTLCEGHRFMTEIPGCKRNLEVCCLTWNKYHVRDMRDKGLDVIAMPWSQQKEIGGKGVLDPHSSDENRKKKSKKRHGDNSHHEKTHRDIKHPDLHDNPPILVIL